MTLDSNFAVKETAIPEAVTQETALKENGALANEAMAALAAPRKLEPEQLTGITNVVSNFGEGVVSELIHNPGTLALNAAGSFGIGYLANKGLQSAAMRVPTIGLMTAAGGYGLYQLGAALPGWKQSYDIASDPAAHDAASVLQAEKHIQSIGGGTLEFAVGGVAGGLAFKPGVSAAAESLLARTRATIFGEKPPVKQFGPDGKEILLADEINGLAGASATDSGSAALTAGSEIVKPRRMPQAFAADEHGNFSKEISLSYGDDAIPEGVITGHTPEITAQNHAAAALSDEAAQVAARVESTLSRAEIRKRNAESGATFDTESTTAMQFIAAVDRRRAVNHENILPGLSRTTDSRGKLLKTTEETQSGTFDQYYQTGKDKALSSVFISKRGDEEAVTVQVLDGEFFVSSRDGGNAQWRGALGSDGRWTKAADETYATPYETAKALPRIRYPEESQNGLKYAAEVDASPEVALAGPQAREVFRGEPRQLIKRNEAGYDSYFRYDDANNLVGWTIKTANGHALELKVTGKSVQIPLGDGTHTTWRGSFRNGVWSSDPSEKFAFPEVLMQHLLWL